MSRQNIEKTVVVRKTTRVEIGNEEVCHILRDAVGAPSDAEVEIGEYGSSVIEWTVTESGQ